MCLDFVFDSRNRLIQSGSTGYRYNVENQRVGVNQTQYVVNSQPALSQVLVKTEADGSQTFYVYGLGLIGQEQGGEYITYHFDFRGSTVVLTNNAGQVTERMTYSPYGELLTQPVHNTPFWFNGRYGVMTDSSGLYYMRARFYSPEIRRFVNQDILLGNVKEGQSLNRYAYVTGRAVNSVDPFGLFTVSLRIIIYNLLTAMAIKDEASDIAKQMGNDDREKAGKNAAMKKGNGRGEDAFRHCLGSCMSVVQLGVEYARVFGDFNEVKGAFKGLHSGASAIFDLYNNECGYASGKEAKNTADCISSCSDGIIDGSLARDGYWPQLMKETPIVYEVLFNTEQFLILLAIIVSPQ